MTDNDTLDAADAAPPKRASRRRRRCLESIPGYLEQSVVLQWIAGASPEAIAAAILRGNKDRKVPVETSRSSVERLLTRVAETDCDLARLAVVRRIRTGACTVMDQLWGLLADYDESFAEAETLDGTPEARDRHQARLWTMAQRERTLHRMLRLAGVTGQAAERFEREFSEHEEAERALFEDRRLKVRQAAIESIRRTEGEEAVPALINLSEEEAQRRRQEQTPDEAAADDEVRETFERRLPDAARDWADHPSLEEEEDVEKSVRVDAPIFGETSRLKADLPPPAASSGRAAAQGAPSQSRPPRRGLPLRNGWRDSTARKSR